MTFIKNSTEVLLDMMYEAINEFGAESTQAKNAVAVYQERVNLNKMLEPDASVHKNDPDLGNFFSDFYKDVTGFRPRFHITVKQVNDWIAIQNTPEALAQRDAQWEQEEIFAREMAEAEVKKQQEDAAWDALHAPLAYDQYDMV